MSVSKILFIGPFFDGTGYANSAINAVIAMHKAGLDVACQNIKLTSQVVDPPDIIKQLLTKKIDKPTHIIQNVLPNMMVKYGQAKNIGFFFSETTHFVESGWHLYLNTMDEVWVSCKESQQAAISSGVKVPIKVVPIAADETKYQQIYPPLTSLKKNRFMFYFIGDFSSRKNVTTLIKAYFRAFSRNDHVVLVLKTFVEGISSQDSVNFIKNEIETIKKNMRMYVNIDDYPPIELITNYLTDAEIMAIHETGDCFVSAECGAAWNLPAFDAFGKGKQVIVNEWGGQNIFIQNNRDNGHFLIKSRKVPVYGMANCGYTGLYTSRQEWYEPDQYDLETAMVQAFHNNSSNLKFNSKHILSIEKSGSIYKEILES